MNNKKIILMSLAFTLCTAAWAGGKQKKEVFIPMDYSTCGYHASERGIPDVRNVVTVRNAEGNCSQRFKRPSTTFRR